MIQRRRWNRQAKLLFWPQIVSEGIGQNCQNWKIKMVKNKNIRHKGSVLRTPCPNFVILGLDAAGKLRK